MKLNHLGSAVAACLIMVAALVGGGQYARAVESEYIHALAPMHVPLNITGSALQRVAFEQSDLLPVYGCTG